MLRHVLVTPRVALALFALNACEMLAQQPDGTSTPSTETIPRPPVRLLSGATIVWSSDWSSGKVKDTWSYVDGNPVSLLSVVSSEGLGFPPGMEHVLRVGYPLPGGARVVAEDKWAEPEIGDMLYFRMYIRFAIRDEAGDQGASSHHPIEPKPGDCPYEWEFLMGSAPNGTWSLYVQHERGAGQFALGSALQKVRTYLLEWGFKRLPDGYTTQVRIDGEDVTSQFRRHDGMALDRASSSPISAECIRALHVGNNGPQWSRTTRSADAIYYGGVAVCTGGWCGAWKREE
jgi:hypothetical protein